MAAMQSTMDKLFEMRMTTMARAYRDLGDAPGTAEMDFDELLAMIVDAEWDARRVNRRMRLLRQAAFSAPDANVADVRYDPDRKLDRERIVDLAGCGWIRDARNVVITGATGSGKTWIGCALGAADTVNIVFTDYTKILPPFTPTHHRRSCQCTFTTFGYSSFPPMSSTVRSFSL